MRKRAWFGLVAMFLAGSARADDRDKVDAALIACTPRTYEMALDCLEDHLPPADDAQLTERDGALRAHFGLGLFIRNNWGLWKGGPLAQSMRAEGFVHPEDMSTAILNGYVARLRGVPFDIRAEAAADRTYWVRMVAAKKAQKQACATGVPVRVDSKVTADCDWIGGL